MKAKFVYLPALLTAGLAACVFLVGCDEGNKEPEVQEPEDPVVETVTDKVYDGWGTFTGTVTDGVPTEGTVVAEAFTYSGTFEDGYKITGTGSMTHSDGTVTEGSYVNGQLDGYGRGEDGRGGLGIGEFKAGQIDGKAFFVWPQGEGAYDWYYGDWVGQKRIGQGFYQFNNGCYYHGEFAEDWINGEGTFHWTGGNYWTGTFVGGSPKTGSYGLGQMDGVQGYIAIGEDGAWSWYNGTLEDGTEVVDGQVVSE